jgi:hypothetical protein
MCRNILHITNPDEDSTENSTCKLLRRIDSLLGNDWVNIFQRKRTRSTIGRPLIGNGSVNKPSQ